MFFFNDTATSEIYTYLHTLSLHDALPIWRRAGPLSSGERGGTSIPTRPRASRPCWRRDGRRPLTGTTRPMDRPSRSEEHTSELQSLMRISYAVFCLKKKKYTQYTTLLTK